MSAGSAVCGAAAAIAMSSVVRTDDRQTAVAVATVVLFGTLGMFLYPWLFDVATGHLHLAIGQKTFGIYTGATLHEVAQVIASGKMIGDQAADAAVVAKMVRVLALAPLLLVVALWPRAGWSPEGNPSSSLSGLGAARLEAGAHRSRQLVAGLRHAGNRPAYPNRRSGAGWKPPTGLGGVAVRVPYGLRRHLHRVAC